MPAGALDLCLQVHLRLSSKLRCGTILLTVPPSAPLLSSCLTSGRGFSASQRCGIGPSMGEVHLVECFGTLLGVFHTWPVQPSEAWRSSIAPPSAACHMCVLGTLSHKQADERRQPERRPANLAGSGNSLHTAKTEWRSGYGSACIAPFPGAWQSVSGSGQVECASNHYWSACWAKGTNSTLTQRQ